MKALYKYLKLVYKADAMCLCAGDYKEIEEVKEYKHYVQQNFYLGPLFVFLNTPSSLMCEALFLAKD